MYILGENIGMAEVDKPVRRDLKISFFEGPRRKVQGLLRLRGQMESVAKFTIFLVDSPSLLPLTP